MEFPLRRSSRHCGAPASTGRLRRGRDRGARSPSGRVTRLRLVGLRPEVIAGDRFRAPSGASELRSTAFEIGRAADPAIHRPRLRPRRRLVHHRRRPAGAAGESVDAIREVFSGTHDDGWLEVGVGPVARPRTRDSQTICTFLRGLSRSRHSLSPRAPVSRRNPFTYRSARWDPVRHPSAWTPS